MVINLGSGKIIKLGNILILAEIIFFKSEDVKNAGMLKLEE